MAKRTTTHNGRGKGGRGYSARHNDRDFDVTVTEHIAPELVATNVEWCIEEGATFDAAELHFYQEHFQEQLDATNEGYIANRHKERCRTMDEWRKLRQNAPEESLFQIGRRHDEKGNLVDQFVPGDILLAVYQEFVDFQNEWSEAHGRPFTILDYAMHCDEPGAADHIHQRRVWHYTDENGMLRVGQEKALEAAGVERPHPERYEGRYNNRKIAFDNMMREKWIDICEAHGIEVERTPVPGRRKRTKDLETYIREKNEALIDENATLEKTAAAWHTAADMEEERAAAAHQEASQARQKVAELEKKVNTLTGELHAKTEALEAVEHLTPIKSEEEYRAIGAAAAAELDEVEDLILDFGDQIEEAEEQFGGAGALKEIAWRYKNEFMPRVMQLLTNIREKIGHMAIFEAIKGVKEKLSDGLRERLAGAMRRSDEQRQRAGTEEAARQRTDKDDMEI